VRIDRNRQRKEKLGKFGSLRRCGAILGCLEMHAPLGGTRPAARR